MSHYTAIRTKYKNSLLLKKCINKLNHPYTEHKRNIEIYTIPSKQLSVGLYQKNYSDYISFQLNKLNYDMVSDLQSWTQKDSLNEFLKKLEVNYGYSETISQALELGFTRSRKVLGNKENNKFIFQRYVQVPI
uniref:Uncharacterized protein ycf35 n=1 Tax=Dictyopteris divaricata TaxID=156996 RepID=A0A2I4Q2L8_9PHAE|nr:hypothetical protein [Dictyopteris divaricata]YP_010205376.1 hypothetical protein LK366_pgp015 [Grateloupia livida]AQZ25087.1 hypothetical protein [Dictyopteris divaricata]UAV85945.1 hypothetical protein [Grateloupia livida]